MSVASNTPITLIDRCEVYEDDEDCEDEEGDYESEGDGDVNIDFLTLHQVMENEHGRYVSMDLVDCDVSHNLNLEDLVESSPVQYHLAPSPQFENVENFGNVVSSDWTPWVNHNTGNSSGEFVVDQVFNSKVVLQDVVKLCSINAHQHYVVVLSSKKLLVLRCKKVEECRCPWKLRVMVVKYTSLFVIKKYNASHNCVNPCLNRNHQQLDSNLVVAYIKIIIKAHFTLPVAAIQVSIMKKFGYEISYKKALLGKHKAFTNLLGDFYKSYA